MPTTVATEDDLRAAQAVVQEAKQLALKAQQAADQAARDAASAAAGAANAAAAANQLATDLQQSMTAMYTVIDAHARRLGVLEERGGAVVTEPPAPVPVPAPPAVPLASIAETRMAAWLTGNKGYDDPKLAADLARVQVATIGMYREWKGASLDLEKASVAAMRKLNPKIELHNYVLMMECNEKVADGDASNDLVAEVIRRGQFLRSGSGALVQWTKQYGKYDINIAKPPADGDVPFAEWFAQRCHNVWFKEAGLFDGCHWDNVTFDMPPSRGVWLADGIERSPTDPLVQAAWFGAYRQAWAKQRALTPGLRISANTADHDLSLIKGELDDAWLEKQFGASWSVGNNDWPKAFKRITTAQANLRDPAKGKIIMGATHTLGDLRLVRHALSTALLTDAYFSLTDLAADYKTVPWYPEFDLRIGMPAMRVPTQPLSSGLWFRRYQGGVVLCNPTGSAIAFGLDGTYRNAAGESLTSVSVAAKDGAVLVKA